jgi:hypothetical protein
MGKSAAAVSICRGEVEGADIRNLAVSRMYLLKTMVLELSVIQVLRNSQRVQDPVHWRAPTQCIPLGERRLALAPTSVPLGSPWVALAGLGRGRCPRRTASSRLKTCWARCAAWLRERLQECRRGCGWRRG